MAHQGTTKADPSDEYPARARDLVFDQISKLSRPHEQLERLMVVINMPTQYRLPNTVLPFGRATSIVEWAMGEGGCGLEALKVAIEDLIAQQGTFPNSRQTPPEATDRLLHEKTGSPPKGLFKNRRAVAIPVLFSILMVSVVSVVAYLRFNQSRAREMETIPPSGTTSSVPMAKEPPKATAEPVSKLSPNSSPSTMPSWRDISARVAKEYESVVVVGVPEKSGPFICTKAPDPKTQIGDWRWEPASDITEGTVCRQDVEITEQEANENRYTVKAAVMYKYLKGRWQFWKLYHLPADPASR